MRGLFSQSSITFKRPARALGITCQLRNAQAGTQPSHELLVHVEWTDPGGLGLVKASYEECRRQADYCEQMARKAITPEQEAAWLRCAADWLSLTVAGLKIARR